MPGFGLFNFGLGPFGLGSPAEPPSPPTGSVGSKWINSSTRNYEIDPGTKNLKQMPGVRQMVLLAINTVQLSAASVPRFGTRVPNKMGSTFEAECKNATRTALRHMTNLDDPLIKINFINVTKGRNSRAEIMVDYTDLTTGDNDRVSN